MKPDKGEENKKYFEEKERRESLRVHPERMPEANKELQSIPEKKDGLLKLVQKLLFRRIELQSQNEEFAGADDSTDAALERYIKLYDFAPVGYFTLDNNSTILQTNLTGAAMLGEEPELLKGKSFRDFIRAKSLPSFNDFICSVFGETDKKFFETEFCLKGSPPVYVQGKAVADGKNTGCLLALTDITGRKNAETALKESEELYRTLAETSPSMIYMVGRSGTVKYVNSTAARRLDMQGPAIIGKKIHDLFPIETADRYMEGISAAAEGNNVSHSEVLDKYPSGDIWIEAYLSPVRDSEGNVTGVLGILNDISARKKAEDEMKESEERYRVLTESSGDIIFTHDLDGVFSYVNRTGADLLGMSQEEIVGKNVADLFPPEFSSEQHRQVAEVVSTKKPLAADMKLLIRGEQLWHNVLLMPLMGEDGTVDGIMGSVRDVTDWKRAEEELRESEERFSQVAESTGKWIWEVDADGLYTYASPAVERILGFKPDEIVGRVHFYDLFAPEEYDEKRQETLEKFASKVPFKGFVCRNLHKNGDTLVLETSGVPHVDEEGRFIGYRGVDTDITERTRAENALRKSEEKYRNLVENISDVIFTLDLEGRITYISPVIEKTYGFTQDEILGNKFSHFVHPDDLPGVMEGFRQRVKGEYHENMFRINDKKGREHYVRTTLTPITEDGAVTGFNYIMTDFTERKHAEEALKETNRKLNMLSSITRHDILNMIMVIREYLEMSGEAADESVIRGYIAKKKEAVDAIQHQIEFTKYYQDIGVEEPGWQNAGEIVGEAEKQLGISKIYVENSLKGIEIFADPLVGKVFYNLMENSLRHGEHVTSIGLSYSKSDDGLTISYRDNGVGIGEEEKKELFVRGFGKNTGLGLFLSREILSITGITIDENGEPGKGVNFEIKVPEGKFRTNL